jgi:hypothetical protein
MALITIPKRVVIIKVRALFGTPVIRLPPFMVSAIFKAVETASVAKVSFIE